MKMHLPKLIKKLITFPKTFPRAAHPRQLALCMLFLIFTGAGSRGGLLWADTWPPIPAADTNGQITVASKTITLEADIDLSSLTLLVTGNVTIDLKGHTLTVGTLLVGGQNQGVKADLTVTDSSGNGSTLKVSTYDVANDKNTSLTIDSGATVKVTGIIYLNTDAGHTSVTGSGSFDLSSAGQNPQYSVEISNVVTNTVNYTEPAGYEGSDYYWTGLGTDTSDWTDKKNWTVVESDTSKFPVAYPGEKKDSTVTFPSTISSALTLQNVQLGDSSLNLEITNSSAESLTLTLASGAAFNNVTINSGKITVKGNFSVSSLTNAGSLTVATITSCQSLTNNDGSIEADSITADSVFSNSTIKTQNLSVSDIKFGNESTKAGTLEFTGNGTLTVTSGTTDSFFNDILIDNGATLTLASDIKVYGNWTNNNTSEGLTAGTSKVTYAGSGKTIGGSQTFGNVEFTGSGNTVSGDNTFGSVTVSAATTFSGNNTFTDVTSSANTSFSGNNTFTNFTCTSSGVTLTFGAGKTQTVTGAFTIENCTLTSSGSWNLDVTPANASVSNATIIKSNSTNAYISAVNSTDGGGNINWDFTGNTYTWTGTSSSAWTTASNWSPASVPGPSTNANIPGGRTNYPDVSSQTIQITNLILSDSTSKVTLSGASDLTVSGTLTNKGSLVFSSSGRIKNGSGNAINDPENNGTVEYRGGTEGSPQTITDYGTTDYANLFISSGVAESSSDITVGNNLIITGSVTINSDITVSSDFILLGASYNTTDQETNIPRIYTYPGNLTLPASTDTYSAQVTCGAGSSITSKNFYANGITGLGTWNLNLPSNYNVSESTNFAQAFYCDFSNAEFTITSTTPGSLKIMAENCKIKDGFTDGWDYEDFEIDSAKTVNDDVLEVTFNREVRNLGSSVYSGRSNIIITDTGERASGIYSDASCSTSLPSTSSNASAARSTLYIKSPETWNTDATGTDAGSGTDRSGNSKSVTPVLKITRDSTTLPYYITDMYGKRLKNYAGSTASTAPFTAITDSCGPALISVRTGQEIHSEYNAASGAESQPHYDSHNFLEFSFSEALEIDQNEWPAGETENIPVTDNLGAVTSSLSATTNLTLAGLCQIENGQIYTGSAGSANKYVNAFYIPQSTENASSIRTIRLSIAGYTSGTLEDRSSGQHKIWPGYIESAVQPSGSITLPSSVQNGAIKDAAGNNIISAKSTISVNSTESGLYGAWDLTPPAAAPLRLDISTAWEEGDYNEAIGNSRSGEAYIDEIEFHFFDNKPSYTSQDAAAWHTERGWIVNNSNDTLYTDFSYTADIIGGARAFDSDASRRTSGGIRFSTIAASVSAFKYTASQSTDAVADTSFESELPYRGAKGTLFTGSSEVRRAADRHDGLYFGLAIKSNKYTVMDSFTISYDESTGFVTDLAGNRLRSQTIHTIDRTPPSYDITLSPVNQKQACIIINKNIMTSTDDVKFYTSSGNKVQFTEDFASLITKCFEVITIDSSGNPESHESLAIDTSVPAEIQHITSETTGSEVTAITLTLNQNLTVENLKNSYFRLINPSDYGNYSIDPVTGIENVRVTFIQDAIGNYMNMFEAHAISELAINAISPQYAYSSDTQPATGWSVHDWNADQQNFGTLPLNHDYDIVSSAESGVNGAQLCFTSTPESSSISTKINSDLNQNYRIWLPALTGYSFSAFTFAPSSTSSYQNVQAASKDNQLIHTISSEMTSSLQSGTQVSFLYALTNSQGSLESICNIPSYDIATGLYDTVSANRIPLFAVRLLDSSDLFSLDLWSFKLKSLTLQRGGVTIFNNVINVTNGESLTLQVDVAEEGTLNVMIMTLDGNIIDYLAHGKTAAGTYHYSWNGRNKAGNPVARGMYFIRVTGKNFDETRKVMVVR